MKMKGFTLIELLLAVGISSAMVLAGTAIFHQVILGSDRGASQTVATTDAHQAVLAIKKDLMVAQETDLVDGSPVPQSSVNLSWADYTSFDTANTTNHFSTYTLSGTNLLRNHDGEESIVGRHIDYVGFTQDGRVISVTITATGTGASQRSEILEFSAYIRTEGGEQ
jgi:prepilin-type N-terminal cleavage/methylation domain-containing protein